MVSFALSRRFCGSHPSLVRMLCRRSASLMMTTRMSWLMAKNIFRRFQACFSSIEATLTFVSLVTPSTRSATVSPNKPLSWSSEAEVSSTVSWSRAAQMVSSSMRRSLARMSATSTGWLMYGSPERLRWSRW